MPIFYRACVIARGRVLFTMWSWNFELDWEAGLHWHPPLHPPAATCRQSPGQQAGNSGGDEVSGWCLAMQGFFGQVCAYGNKCHKKHSRNVGHSIIWKDDQQAFIQGNTMYLLRLITLMNISFFYQPLESSRRKWVTGIARHLEKGFLASLTLPLPGWEKYQDIARNPISLD